MKLLEDRPGTKAHTASTELLDFTLARFIRLRLQGMHTTSHSSNSIQWLVDRKELNKRSFYSLRFIKIGARLDCSGHARRAKQYNSDEVGKRETDQKRGKVEEKNVHLNCFLVVCFSAD